jgi:hypothetical protein
MSKDPTIPRPALSLAVGFTALTHRNPDYAVRYTPTEPSNPGSSAGTSQSIGKNLRSGLRSDFLPGLLQRSTSTITRNPIGSGDARRACLLLTTYRVVTTPPRFHPTPIFYHETTPQSRVISLDEAYPSGPQFSRRHYTTPAPRWQLQSVKPTKSLNFSLS